jgi:hypothetical protein
MALAAQIGAGDPTLSQPVVGIAATAWLSDLKTCVCRNPPLVDPA